MVRGGWLPQEASQGMLDDLAAKYEVPKNIQLIIASVLAVGALLYLAFVIWGIRTGNRRLSWEMSWGRILRIVLLALVPIVWWIFWHTDTVFSHILRARPENAVTVRILIPWPAAFIWVSWAVTLWFVTWIAVTLTPRVKPLERK